MARQGAVFLSVQFFFDKPGVLSKLSKWQHYILSRTGAYGRKTMRNLFKPPLKNKKARTVEVELPAVVGNYPHQRIRAFVSASGEVTDLKTGKRVSLTQAVYLRQLVWSRLRGQGEGKPPRIGPTGKLKKYTFSSLDPQRESVVIGPDPFPQQPTMFGRVSVPELLDKGGDEIVLGQLVRYGPRPYVERCLDPTLKFMQTIIQRHPIDRFSSAVGLVKVA